MKQFKVIAAPTIVYREPSLDSDQVDSLPVGLFVNGTAQGRWVSIPMVGYVLAKHLEVL